MKAITSISPLSSTWASMRRMRCGYAHKPASMVTQGVTHIVQANGVRKLREQQTHHMAPRREGAALALHTMLAGEFGNQIFWNEIAQRMEHREAMLVVIVFSSG